MTAILTVPIRVGGTSFRQDVPGRRAPLDVQVGTGHALWGGGFRRPGRSGGPDIVVGAAHAQGASFEGHVRSRFPVVERRVESQRRPRSHPEERAARRRRRSRRRRRCGPVVAPSSSAPPPSPLRTPGIIRRRCKIAVVEVNFFY